jgi:hypothetical protein
MDSHAPVSRPASDGNAMRGKLAHAASSDMLASTMRWRRTDAHRNAPSQNLLHRAC